MTAVLCTFGAVTARPALAADTSSGSSYPPDLVTTASAPCASDDLPAGWVDRENQLSGTPDWRPPAAPGAVGVYLDDPSVACGDTLGVRLGGQGASGVQVRVVRVGWYGGIGGREVWRSASSTVAASPEPEVADHVVPAAGWTTRVAVEVPPSWVPGLYLAEALVGGAPTGAAGFVVRHDGTAAPLVAVHSNLTWSAYSDAGGASLYRGPVPVGATRADAVAARAYRVSMLRPTLNGGLSKLLVDDVPLAQLTDELGLPTDHLLDTDLEIRPSRLRGHAGILLPGHSEYWTARAYDALTAERDAGVNLADLGANSVYWHARVSSDDQGAPLENTVYRDAALDPLAADDPQQATVRWQDSPLSRPSSAVVGQGYVASPVVGGLVVHHPPDWLVAGTAVQDGTQVPSSVLNEADGARADDPAAPPNLQVVLEGVLRATDKDVLVSSTYYSDPSGAGVFAAGMTSWLCDIVNTCPEARVPSQTSALLESLTGNLLRAFTHPRWGADNPSSHDVPSSATDLLAELPPSAVGIAGNASALPSASLQALPVFTLSSAQALTWSGSDVFSTIASYDVRYQRARYDGGFGAWTYPSTWQQVRGTSLTASGLMSGNGYCFAVRSRDLAGNVSPWTASRCTARPLDDRSLVTSAGWGRGTGSSYYLSTVTSATGSALTLTRTGARVDRVGLVATTCSTCGSVGVYVNGVLFRSVSLLSSTTHRRVLFTLPAFSLRSATVVVKSLQRAHLVQVDGLALSRT